RTMLAAIATAEMGKPLTESLAEIDRTVAEIEFTMGEPHRLFGQSIPTNTAGGLAVTTRVPLGVVAAVTPWNFPALAVARKVAPALASGNTIVCKPAPSATLTALAMTDLLLDTGLPDGVMNTVCGEAAAGALLCEHPLVDGISFTGSSAVGRRIAEAAGRRLVPVQLELGGKNAVYLHETADLDAAVTAIVAAATQCSGQRCTAISRVLADDAIHDEVVARLAAAFDALTVGRGTDPGVDIGPLVTPHQQRRVLDYIHGALADGAVRRTVDRPVPPGPYVAPTVLTDVDQSSAAFQDEIFGPVLVVVRVGGVEDAVAALNNSRFGLAAAVFTSETAVALRVHAEADVGMLHINHGTSSQAHVPFGGAKDSGLGAFSIGSTNLDFFTKTKVLYLTR
ncbi:aldehyde dehydrogenase, partial [Mycobacterium sp. NAZ190054]|uniref:aldehyde dehydrogenase family protein n=1 Tax=Mycobacterium sp. NAZ190054 TaxID=1747766 RepID=UPI000B00A41B